MRKYSQNGSTKRAAVFARKLKIALPSNMSSKPAWSLSNKERELDDWYLSIPRSYGGILLA